MRGANKTKQSNQAGDKIIQTKINSKRREKENTKIYLPNSV